MDHGLSHLDARGLPCSVDIGSKAVTRREAVAEALLEIGEELMGRLVATGFRGTKGGIVETAIVAGLQAAKRTPELIPMCHLVPLEQCEVRIEPHEGTSLRVTCRAVATHKTGVEMEALTGASVAALTLYDMLKALDHGLVIRHVRLCSKTGGKSDFQRRPETSPAAVAEVRPLKVEYFGSLREQAGRAAEEVSSAAATPRALYAELAARHGFSLAVDCVRSAIGEDLVPLDHPLDGRGTISFLPPVSGG